MFFFLHVSALPSQLLQIPFHFFLYYLLNLFSQFFLTLSPPLALLLQLSVQTAFLPVQTTAPPSSSRLAEPAATSCPSSPRASRSLQSAHRVTPRRLLLPNICHTPPKAFTLLRRHQTPPQLQPHRKLVAALEQEPLQSPPAHWP